MKKNILLAFTLSLFAISCTQKSGSITGTFTGLTNDTLRIQVSVLNDDNSFEYQRTDIVVVQRNQFTYNPQTNNLTKLVILPRENTNDRFHYNGAAILFYSPGDRITLSANTINNFVTYTASGNLFNEQLSTINENRRRYMLDNKLTFIRENPDEPLSAYLVTLIRCDREMLNFAHILGSEARKSVFEQMLEQRISIVPAHTRRGMEMLMAQGDMIGTVAPDFSLKDISGNDFTLSSLRGRYVMLNFWGSWCGGCFLAFPGTIEYYTAHADEFHIVGIAFADTPEAWRSAVERAGLPWINVIDDDNNSVSAQYFMFAAPSYVLINKEGVLVGFTNVFREVAEYLDALRLDPNFSQEFFYEGWFIRR